MADDDRDAGAALEAAALGVFWEVGTGSARGRSHTEIERALRMRSEGVAYAAIGRAVRADPRTVRRWCAAAAAIEPGFDPTRGRRESPLSFRPAAGMAVELESQAHAEGVRTADLLRRYVAAGLGAKLPAPAPVVAEFQPLDPAALEVLVAVRDALSEQALEVSAQGNNANQIARFVHTYRELPTTITASLTAFTAAIDRWSVALDRLSAAIEAVAE